MRLFISYARVDKPYCQQIVETLNVHEVWYDQRLHAGQQWWDEILRHLDWCEGLVYLLSPESIASPYCQDEFRIAKDAGKHLIPVIIRSNANIPPELAHVQYANLSDGLTSQAVKTLLDAIYVAERQVANRSVPVIKVVGNPTQVKVSEAIRAIEEAADAIESGDFDKAVFVLKQIKETDYRSRFVSVDDMLIEAERELERQIYLREAEREYAPIALLVKRNRTRHQGCTAFNAFKQVFADYDPENLKSLCDSYRNNKITEVPSPAQVVSEINIYNGLPDWLMGVTEIAYTHNFEISDLPSWLRDSDKFYLPMKTNLGKIIATIDIDPFYLGGDLAGILAYFDENPENKGLILATRYTSTDSSVRTDVSVLSLESRDEGLILRIPEYLVQAKILIRTVSDLDYAIAVSVEVARYDE